MRFKGWLIAFVTVGVLVCAVSAAADVGSGSGPPTAIGTGGAAASVEKLATEAAVGILRRGGNAVDAAVASAAVLGVTEPFSCGIGGGGFMVIRTAGGRVTTIDGREAAPMAMHPTSFWEGTPAPCPSTTRATAASRSVCPARWRRGPTCSRSTARCRWPRSSRRGFTLRVTEYVVDQVWFDQVNANRDWFDDIPASAALFLDPDGTPRNVRHRVHESRARKDL